MNNYYRSAKSAVKVAKHLAPLTVDFAHYLKSCFIDYYFFVYYVKERQNNNYYYRSAKSTVKVAKKFGSYTVDFAHLKSCFIHSYKFFFVYYVKERQTNNIITEDVQSLRL